MMPWCLVCLWEQEEQEEAVVDLLLLVVIGFLVEWSGVLGFVWRCLPWFWIGVYTILLSSMLVPSLFVCYLF